MSSSTTKSYSSDAPAHPRATSAKRKDESTSEASRREPSVFTALADSFSRLRRSCVSPKGARSCTHTTKIIQEHNVDSLSSKGRYNIVNGILCHSTIRRCWKSKELSCFNVPKKKIGYFLLIGKPRKEIGDQKSQRQILTHNLNFQG